MTVGKSSACTISVLHLVKIFAKPDDVAGQVRIVLQQPRVVLAGRDDQRHPAVLGVVEHGSGRGEAWGGVQIEEADLAARPGVALGHAGTDDLVEPKQVANVARLLEGVHELDSRSPRECRTHTPRLRGAGAA